MKRAREGLIIVLFSILLVSTLPARHDCSAPSTWYRNVHSVTSGVYSRSRKWTSCRSMARSTRSWGSSSPRSR